MTIIQAIVSGVVQGLTEFFPVSSSGHLVILHSVFGVKESTLVFDLFLHFGTVISVVVFFREDIISIIQKDRTLLRFLVIGSIPTFFIGMLLKDKVESLFAAPLVVGYSLLVTGIFLFVVSLSAIYWKITRSSRPIGTVNSIVVGIAQGIAVIPGISRSGATIGTALIAGVSEIDALKFSFLLSIPAVLGANVLKARQIYGNLMSADTAIYMAGGIAAAITGLLAIKVLFGVLKKNLFFLFGVYCILTGAAVVVLSR